MAGWARLVGQHPHLWGWEGAAAGLGRNQPGKVRIKKDGWWRPIANKQRRHKQCFWPNLIRVMAVD